MLSRHESELEAALEAIAGEVPFSFSLEDDAGEFVFVRGLDVEARIESASTSKWVAATLILWVTERSDLSLDSTVGDFFTSNEASMRSAHSPSAPCFPFNQG